ncbi:membrane protein [Sphaerisporangium krabiense]|uniref:Serine phosphatase RsbU (Regulator of sigma subunit) n=1 Tax=Sphaerisporangium krabiense TaxID=763782 RepID=A0A7W9DQE0_9ACTN|nr:PP2C family protein-serine/threonine phosphatase [Sphaerisporangium krabiense]MBB5626290.1 serine phosphatase RsbU (regulator of sigma subunit) [Sphaerisporangium krabiense]GII66045.1 membrane protein [Sphaerisporangium krabiense]
MTRENRRTQTLMAALPFASLGIVAAVDVLTGPDLGYLSLLAVGPAFASLVGGVRRTVLIGVIALVTSLLLAVYNDLLGDRQSTMSLVSITGVTAASILATVGRQRRERELATVRSVAEVAQRVLLRPVPRRAGHLRAAVSYTSANAEARIGGDLYEVVTGPGGVRAIVGDVQGKGLEAVETAALVLGAFREAAHDEPDLRGVSGRLEKALNRRLSGEEFVTAILVDADPAGKLTLLNYGHPPPLIIHADGEITLAEPADSAPPLGLAVLEVEGPNPHQVAFGPGDQVLLYTDGVIEARDRAGRFYPLAERAFLLKDDDPEAALEALRLDLVHHVDAPLHDDAAMLLLRFRDG